MWRLRSLADRVRGLSPGTHNGDAEDSVAVLAGAFASGKYTAEQLQPLFGSLTSAVLEHARTDPEAGLAAMDRLLAFGADVPEWAASVGALGYNRAALLLGQGRTAEALAAYQDVERRFGAHGDVMVQFWLAITLYNHVQVLVSKGADEVAAEQVPPLVTELQERLAGHPHPTVQRRIRVARLMEIELFQRLGRAEEETAARERLHDLLRPAAAVVAAKLAEDEAPPVSEAARPRWPTPLIDHVLSVLENLDDVLDAIRKLAGLPTDAWLTFEVENPVLLTGTVVVMLAAVAEGTIPGAHDDDDRDLIRQGLAAIVTGIQFFDQDDAEYPPGTGPIEALLSAVDVSLGIADALALARSPAVVRQLNLPYVAASAYAAVNAFPTSGWRLAARWHLLLLAAAERLPDTTEGRAMVVLVRFRWLFVARQVLVHMPDGRVLASAADAGRLVIETFEAAPERGAAHIAEVLLALAALYIEPFNVIRTNSDRIDLSELRRWRDRPAEETLDPVEVPDGVEPVMPELDAALGIGEEHLRRALELADPVQVAHILGLQLTAREIRRRLGEPVDEKETVEMATRMAAAADPERYPQLLTHALLTLASYGKAAPEQLDRLLARPIDDIAEEAGQDGVVNMLVGAGAMLGSTDLARAREVFAAAAGYVRGLPERDRIRVLHVHGVALQDAADLPPGDLDEDRDPGEIGAELAGRAAAEGWPADRAAVALIALARVGLATADDWSRERSWLAVLDIVPLLHPEFAARHGDALGVMAAGWCTQVSYRAEERGDRDHALRAQAAAVDRFLTLGLPDAAMESLTIIARLVRDAVGATLLRPAAEALRPLAVRAENLIGAPATTVLQDIWSRLLGAVAEDADGPALLACLELAKGVRFADALAAGRPFDASEDEEARSLLDAIERAAPPAERDSTLDGVTLVTPYTEQLDTGGVVSAALRRENLERHFDALVQRRLNETAADPAPLMFADEILDLLPADAVLLWSYATRLPDGGRALLTLAFSGDRMIVTPVRLQPATEAGSRLEVRHDGRVRVLDELGAHVAALRWATLAEPGPVRLVARDSQQPFEQLLPGLYGPVSDMLREEHAAGRRHLIVVPHGPLHFAPLHLLHLDGRPLAETWTVTYLPNLALLRPPGRAAAKTAVVSVGLGFPEGQLEPIPEAVSEAEAVAAAFGIPALTEPAATERAVLDGLARARWFHIATHGEHNVTAPAFQCLHVADQRISAHELLRLDLSGLELVTLSACETALGRFDAADNLRGIPASLLLRGAQAIVGTLWPVETQTSRDFFTTLYRTLRSGGTRLAAFAAAQEQTRAAHPQYRDWGAFYYAGDWR